MRILFWFIIKELKQMWRDKVALFSWMAFPIVFMLFFGFAFIEAPFNLKNIPTLLIQNDDGGLAEDIVNSLQEIDAFDFKSIERNGSLEMARELVEEEKYKVAIMIPQDLSQKVAKGERPTITLIVDGKDLVSAKCATTAMDRFIQAISQQYSLVREPIALEEKVLYNGNLRYIDFMAPGILAAILMFFCMDATGMTIVKDREKGTLRRLLVIPLKLRTIIESKLIANLLVSVVICGLILLMGILIFDTCIRGSLGLVILLEFMTALVFLGLGLMISALAKTVDEAHLIGDALALPLLLISGCFFTVETMPKPLLYLAKISPLTYATDALRAVMIKGASFGDITTQMIILVLFIVATLGLGMMLFRKE